MKPLRVSTCWPCCLKLIWLPVPSEIPDSAEMTLLKKYTYFMMLSRSFLLWPLRGLYGYYVMLSTWKAGGCHYLLVEASWKALLIPMTCCLGSLVTCRMLWAASQGCFWWKVTWRLEAFLLFLSEPEYCSPTGGKLEESQRGGRSSLESACSSLKAEGWLLQSTYLSIPLHSSHCLIPIEWEIWLPVTSYPRLHFPSWKWPVRLADLQIVVEAARLTHYYRLVKSVEKWLKADCVLLENVDLLPQSCWPWKVTLEVAGNSWKMENLSCSTSLTGWAAIDVIFAQAE